MIDAIPTRWSFGGSAGYPPLPDSLCCNSIWVRLDGRDFAAVSALNVEEGWIEVMACGPDGRKLVHANDAVRVRLHGKVEQGLRENAS